MSHNREYNFARDNVNMIKIMPLIALSFLPALLVARAVFLGMRMMDSNPDILNIFIAGGLNAILVGPYLIIVNLLRIPSVVADCIEPYYVVLTQSLFLLIFLLLCRRYRSKLFSYLLLPGIITSVLSCTYFVLDFDVWAPLLVIPLALFEYWLVCSRSGSTPIISKTNAKQH